jgi:hypothetical protein
MNEALLGAATDLLTVVPRPPEMTRVPVATDFDIQRLQNAFEFELPKALLAWLRACNGAPLGPGGLLGSSLERPSDDILSARGLVAAYMPANFLPVATDGCGNLYVIRLGGDPARSNPVYFAEVRSEPFALEYTSASSLEHFYYLFLKSDTQKDGWPFSEQYTLLADPGMRASAEELGAPHPWELARRRTNGEQRS